MARNYGARHFCNWPTHGLIVCFQPGQDGQHIGQALRSRSRGEGAEDATWRSFQRVGVNNEDIRV